MSRINEEQWGEFLAELNARNAAVQPPATPQEPEQAQTLNDVFDVFETWARRKGATDTSSVSLGFWAFNEFHAIIGQPLRDWLLSRRASTPSPEGQTTWHDRGVQPPATPQEPTGAQLALADIEKAYAETEVALAQVVSRNDKELFFNGDKALRAHLQKNLDYYRVRRDGVRALLASTPSPEGQTADELRRIAAHIRTPGNIWAEDAIDEIARLLENRARQLSPLPSPPTPEGAK